MIKGRGRGDPGKRSWVRGPIHTIAVLLFRPGKCIHRVCYHILPTLPTQSTQPQPSHLPQPSLPPSSLSGCSRHPSPEQWFLWRSQVTCSLRPAASPVSRCIYGTFMTHQLSAPSLCYMADTAHNFTSSTANKKRQKPGLPVFSHTNISLHKYFAKSGLAFRPGLHYKPVLYKWQEDGWVIDLYSYATQQPKSTGTPI